MGVCKLCSYQLLAKQYYLLSNETNRLVTLQPLTANLGRLVIYTPAFLPILHHPSPHLSAALLPIDVLVLPIIMEI